MHEPCKKKHSRGNQMAFLTIVSRLRLRDQWRRSGVFIVNFEHISHHVVFVLLTLNMYLQAGNEDKVLRVILKHKNHPNTIAIQNEFRDTHFISQN